MASLALLGYLFNASDLGKSINETWIDGRVRGHGLEGAVLFLLTGGLLTALGLPRQIIAFLGGYAFGLWLGTLLGTVAAVLGCMLSFGYARFLGEDLLRARLGERAGKFSRIIHHDAFAMTVLIRLLPVGNNLLTNLAAGVSGIRAGHFFAASLLGYLPQALVFGLLGSGVHIDQGVKLALAVGLFLASGTLGAYLFRRYRDHDDPDDRAPAPWRVRQWRADPEGPYPPRGPQPREPARARSP
jgi:uncharacterized membrane protein YdjX (TVP38/TMEM64 family)